MLVEGKFLSSMDDLSEVFKIRKEVFIEEQGVSPKEEWDQLDQEAIHVLITVKECNVACGRLLKENDTRFRIGRVAVRKEERGKGYGDFVVRMLIDKAFRCGASEIVLGAQKQAAIFYEKIGFRICGEEYLDADIIHLPMRMENRDLCKKCGNNH